MTQDNPANDIEKIIRKTAPEVLPTNLQEKLEEEITAVVEKTRTVIAYTLEHVIPKPDISRIVRRQLEIWEQEKRKDFEYERYRNLMRQLKKTPVDKGNFFAPRNKTSIRLKLQAIFDKGFTVGTEVIYGKNERGTVKSITTEGMLSIRLPDGKTVQKDPQYVTSMDALRKTLAEAVEASQIP
ncbi:MAG: hypothetical protein ABIH78_02090 [Candidatus Peregrinibacteria bacterium]